MLLRPFPLLIAILIPTACQGTAAALTPTPKPQPTAMATAEPTRHWGEYELDGVTLGITTPPGWEMYQTNRSLVLVEHSGSVASGGELEGMIVYMFVHSTDDFDMPGEDEANAAWAVLQQIVQKPDLVENAVVSDPVGFRWNGHDAAYYLLHSGKNNTLLMALVLPNQDRMFVCNISAPALHTRRIRAMLPEIMAGFTLNGEPMNVADLESLPDPLHFPAQNTDSYSAYVHPQQLTDVPMTPGPSS